LHPQSCQTGPSFSSIFHDTPLAPTTGGGLCCPELHSFYCLNPLTPSGRFFFGLGIISGENPCDRNPLLAADTLFSFKVACDARTLSILTTPLPGTNFFYGLTRRICSFFSLPETTVPFFPLFEFFFLLQPLSMSLFFFRTRGTQSLRTFKNQVSACRSVNTHLRNLLSAEGADTARKSGLIPLDVSAPLHAPNKEAGEAPLRGTSHGYDLFPIKEAFAQESLNRAYPFVRKRTFGHGGGPLLGKLFRQDFFFPWSQSSKSTWEGLPFFPTTLCQPAVKSWGGLPPQEWWVRVLSSPVFFHGL